jgi:flavin reductase (DIM6/NTAB) family NADH-FMN oxidoreductase RutF
MRFSQTESVAPEQFIAALSGVPTAVTIVTTYVEGRPWGLTVSAFASVSAAPPTVLVCVNRHTSTCASIERAGAFGISFLCDDQRRLAETSALPGVPKFLDDHVGVPAADAAMSPAVDGAFCHLHCSVERIVDGGDSHAVVFGRVAAIEDGGDCSRPLVYHSRGFHALGDRLADRSVRQLQPSPVKGPN